MGVKPHVQFCGVDQITFCFVVVVVDVVDAVSSACMSVPFL